jgi:hypothetical protein
MQMRAMTQQAYDPHLLYHAINITVELEYKVPMQKIYKILEIVEANNKKNINKISPQDVLQLLTLLGDRLESSVLDDEPSDNTNLQAKIKELLRLLGCVLSDQELNQILKGELSLDAALSKQAKAAWLMVFNIDEDGKMRPNKEIVDHMLMCAQTIAIENVEIKIQRNIIEAKNMEKTDKRTPIMLAKNENMKTLHRAEREKSDPVLLEKKRNKLRLYIAHMQGYDRDRDRDGGRGIDMTTGYVIDFGDIYIADKHASTIEDIGRDGIDLCDLH